MSAPTTSAEFDRAYRRPITPWGDFRIPDEVRRLAGEPSVRTVLELGCGVGRFSRYLAQQGLCVTGVDFSQEAISRARARVAGDERRPTFLVGDVTRLDGLRGPFDASFDVGCLHCLSAQGHRAYASALSRLLRPGATHLIWAMDTAPTDEAITPELVQERFSAGFTLEEARPSRRRLAASHWYRLLRSA